ncbi:hypothetical protein XA68_13246 [Ophiocordyceps unilateralis]|uniref:Ketopantoate reductase N-terminal domain-containing protein n=1 Tax=Ophiocordyceps unilateralis TaxID=268505 RepID=A0A2A9PNP6_OPHUN|nr:hypothetical protein XA68_13246 [Ophiocordyceps unilateralis]
MARHEVSSPAAKPWARDIERCPSRPQRSETRHQLYSSSSGPATAGWAKGGSSRSAGFSSDPIGSVLRHAQRSSTNVGLATTHHQVKNPPDSSSKPTPSFPPAKPVEKIDFSGPQHSVKNTPDSSSKPTPRFPPAKPVEKIDFSGPQHSVFPVSDPEPPPRVHKVHIIGEDEKAKFMAHALCDIYDSVELLGWRRHVPTKYRNISTGRRQTRQPTLLQRNTVPKRVYAPSDSSHIDLLVVTGPGVHAATALDSVKHRINEKSTVCLMSEGLGVLEDAT